MKTVIALQQQTATGHLEMNRAWASKNNYLIDFPGVARPALQCSILHMTESNKRAQLQTARVVTHMSPQRSPRVGPNPSAYLIVGKPVRGRYHTPWSARRNEVPDPVASKCSFCQPCVQSASQVSCNLNAFCASCRPSMRSAGKRLVRSAPSGHSVVHSILCSQTVDQKNLKWPKLPLYSG
jgi:hypothetical protein